MSTHSSILAWRIPWTEESLLDLPAVPQQGSFDPFKKALSAYLILPSWHCRFSIRNLFYHLTSYSLLFFLCSCRMDLFALSHTNVYITAWVPVLVLCIVLFLPYPSKSNSKQRLSYVWMSFSLLLKSQHVIHLSPDGSLSSWSEVTSMFILTSPAGGTSIPLTSNLHIVRVKTWTFQHSLPLLPTRLRNNQFEQILPSISWLD